MPVVYHLTNLLALLSDKLLDGELGRTPPSAPQFSGKQYFLRGNPQEVGVLANIPH